MDTQISTIIKKLGLVPHPTEGGYFIESYRSTETLPKAALNSDYSGDRSVSTAIYYLLTPQTLSAMHRLCSDEVFHFYLGDPVEQLHLYPDGSTKLVTLGQDIMNGHTVQQVVPKHVWQGARLKKGGSFALLGCTVAPGFNFTDYVHGDRAELCAQFPEQAELITALTPDDPVIKA